MFLPSFVGEKKSLASNVSGYSVTWHKRKRISHIISQFNKIDKTETRIGYFADSGMHANSKMTYATLMGFHELRTPSDPMYRPVFGASIKKGGKAFEAKALKKVRSGILRVAKGGGFPLSSVLDSIGKDGIKMIRPTFGNTSLLKSNTRRTIDLKGGKNTPMVEFGDLRDALSYRTKGNK
jgi:hypothetical protein